jgi:hypothetical protein
LKDNQVTIDVLEDAVEHDMDSGGQNATTAGGGMKLG